MGGEGGRGGSGGGDGNRGEGLSGPGSRGSLRGSGRPTACAGLLPAGLTSWVEDCLPGAIPSGFQRIAGGSSGFAFFPWVCQRALCRLWVAGRGGGIGWGKGRRGQGGRERAGRTQWPGLARGAAGLFPGVLEVAGPMLWAHWASQQYRAGGCGSNIADPPRWGWAFKAMEGGGGEGGTSRAPFNGPLSRGEEGWAGVATASFWKLRVQYCRSSTLQWPRIERGGGGGRRGGNPGHPSMVPPYRASPIERNTRARWGNINYFFGPLFSLYPGKCCRVCQNWQNRSSELELSQKRQRCKVHRKDKMGRAS